jgi:hypothetical protein
MEEFEVQKIYNDFKNGFISYDKFLKDLNLDFNGVLRIMKKDEEDQIRKEFYWKCQHWDISILDFD